MVVMWYIEVVCLLVYCYEVCELVVGGFCMVGIGCYEGDLSGWVVVVVGGV